MALTEDIVTRIVVDPAPLKQGLEQGRQSVQQFAQHTSATILQASSGYRGFAVAAAHAGTQIAYLTGVNDRALMAFQAVNLQSSHMASALTRVGGSVGTVATAITGFLPILGGIGAAATIAVVGMNALFRALDADAIERAKKIVTDLNKELAVTSTFISRGEDFGAQLEEEERFQKLLSQRPVQGRAGDRVLRRIEQARKEKEEADAATASALEQQLSGMSAALDRAIAAGRRQYITLETLIDLAPQRELTREFMPEFPAEQAQARLALIEREIELNRALGDSEVELHQQRIAAIEAMEPELERQAVSQDALRQSTLALTAARTQQRQATVAFIQGEIRAGVATAASAALQSGSFKGVAAALSALYQAKAVAALAEAAALAFFSPHKAFEALALAAAYTTAAVAFRGLAGGGAAIGAPTVVTSIPAGGRGGGATAPGGPMGGVGGGPAGGGGTTVIINVTSGPFGTPADYGQAVEDALVAHSRERGRPIRTTA